MYDELGEETIVKDETGEDPRKRDASEAKDKKPTPTQATRRASTDAQLLGPPSSEVYMNMASASFLSSSSSIISALWATSLAV